MSVSGSHVLQPAVAQAQQASRGNAHHGPGLLIAPLQGDLPHMAPGGNRLSTWGFRKATPLFFPAKACGCADQGNGRKVAGAEIGNDQKCGKKINGRAKIVHENQAATNDTGVSNEQGPGFAWWHNPGRWWRRRPRTKQIFTSSEGWNTWIHVISVLRAELLHAEHQVHRQAAEGRSPPPDNRTFLARSRSRRGHPETETAPDPAPWRQFAFPASTRGTPWQ